MNIKILNLILLRSFSVCMVIAYAALILLSIENKSVLYLEKLIEDNIFLRSLSGFIGAWGALGMFYLWFSMIYDWAHTRFSCKTKKIFCFILVTMGMFVGALLYYFLIFERKLFLDNRKAN